ncbi:DUF1840 domain-containing protein [Legionella oakridgensis]|uniref:DUF1840 domain-containing protein n=2 Tax=Legionella oakridgensis TaxID=29423 RepID=W0BCR5_9GAMM|nr:DUF1840 domain-containing protein [Legionella oakridgensis]AHE66491.1 hypothetical protein Loa_00932 [Legionella oakridgensis ATCC 33761 = DSM 21215]ETO93760.1 hypothetical protein LOR_73c21060 [Legionella oakridgensis RV-2-2007]KTD43939.1 hypothetical protein Loak_0489 [Legionella oakridgensis]STY19656.1 Domain of uncharacterised function (DUF1840) [Legionella longbeachae]
MLVTFSCDAHENITMFGDVAKRLIKMMGHSGTVPSAILADEVPEALARLQHAIAVEKKKAASNETVQDDEDQEAQVSLERRAWPLIELLKDAAKAKCNVMWK